MITPTHLTFSQTFYLTTCIFWSSPASPIGAFVAGLASFLPDFDTRVSLPGRLLPWLSEWIHEHFGHRSITHSFLVQIVTWITFYFLVRYDQMTLHIAIAIASGFFSHICADMLTKTGVFFWWPNRRYRCVAWKNGDYRVKVKENGELLWSIVMAILCVPLFYAAQTERGASGIIRYALGDIEMAVQEYQKSRGFHQWFLKLNGTSNQNLERINGKFYIIAVKNENTFYLLSNEGETITASTSVTGDWFVSKAILEKDSVEKNTTQVFKKERIEFEKLIDALNIVTKESVHCFVTGSLTTEDKQGNMVHHNLIFTTIKNMPKAIYYHLNPASKTLPQLPDTIFKNMTSNFYNQPYFWSDEPP